ncbi:methyltransferase domain-containing protein [Paenibacillus sp. GD4]|jgi:SAM-dependent methyltransferase|uniref:methyltransferase domain-containing protein n=1 Tax=Paenibacillus sp. GD4 TaxID=3068890 RepID=UPI0027963E0B|nr:methyltransferase domain-containing protein [Paenibacillus sp. GD4]MDQ1913363.1 methyltransferase domain-containing protein [Paenibacillus sp. GD4]
MKLDLGCGANKHSNFVGLDRLSLPGVDIVSDMNEPLPFPDNSVAFVMASRSLSYVNDLLAVLSEIYRVCHHKAIVCILAPYAHHFRHMSNPYVRHSFDETTPYYLTNDFFQPDIQLSCPPVMDYAAPAPFDFRLLRMELFYEPSYTTGWYDAEELEALRSSQPNVVREIMYHFLIVKENITRDELVWYSRQPHFEPSCVETLRQAQYQQGQDT